ncbi:MAG: bifunctional 5,10-methylenetetrahydrofolate dehydrogenase/5,10-methenyltetrahydrofolate cyclohydrolase [Ruminococcus sp.]|nr:bifunctional 5,10-methylenetetrahydrofolate dehydrogenase/5,10-methenyltetrahydrofolate cyclohydrolase [Candidatus Apopatosoma intestinale]
MRELTGKPIADRITAELMPKIAALTERGNTPCLGILRVGENEDDLAYERAVLSRFHAAGATVRVTALPDDVTQDELEESLQNMNGDKTVHGILILRPLPPSIDEARVCVLLAPEKDVDGMTDASLARVFRGDRDAFPPCTAAAVMELAHGYGIDFAGKRVTLVGRSLVVGRPLLLLLLAEHATVTVCHTKTADLAAACRGAEIVISCAGKAGLIGENALSDGQTVLDVGMNAAPDGTLCGDVDRTAAERHAAALTPVPRGIGSVTASVLLRHTVEAAEKKE